MQLYSTLFNTLQCRIVYLQYSVYQRRLICMLIWLLKGYEWQAALLKHYTLSRTLRSSDAKLLFVPRVRTCFGSRSFAVAAPTIWNSLPLAIRSSVSIHSFRRKLQNFSLQPTRGVARHFVLGRYKTLGLIFVFNYRFDVILPHKKCEDCWMN